MKFANMPPPCCNHAHRTELLWSGKW